jgi:AcrR family transcriptional regulator
MSVMPSLAPTDRPLRKDAERNRLRILEAAGELFADRGLGVTLDDIARHAGVGVGTVYRRFADKELLIDALFEQRIEAMCAIAAEALERDDPWEAIVYFFEQGSQLQARDRGLKELLGCSAHGGGGVAEARERLRSLITQVFDRAKAAGVVRADAGPFDAPVIAFMVGAVMDRSRDIEPDLWRRYLQIVLDGLRPCAASPLPVEALSPEKLDAVMRRPASR